MTDPLHRGISPEAFDALVAEVTRAAVELSDQQVLDLADTLHGVLRDRRPNPPFGDRAWLAPETRSFG